MGTARPLHKADIEARLRERVVRLELRDAERAKEIMKARAHIMAVERAAKEDRRLRVAAEQNAARFHALLLQERVRKIGAGT